MIKYFCVVVALMVQGYQAKAQDFRLSVFANPDEALAKQVKSIVQDSLGFLWLATDNGVYRFDGKNIDSQPTDQSFSNFGKQVYKLGNGEIWVVHDRGIHRVEQKPVLQGATRILDESSVLNQNQFLKIQKE